MTKKDELRFRVQRFLAGPFNVTDLSTTFLFLRGQSFGRNTVRDIGDMLGHADLRDRGLSVDRVRNLQVIALYKMRAFIGEKSSELDLSDAPPTLLAVMDATLALLDDSGCSCFSEDQTQIFCKRKWKTFLGLLENHRQATVYYQMPDKLHH